MALYPIGQTARERNGQMWIYVRSGEIYHWVKVLRYR